MAQELRALELSQLVDLLAHHTCEYYHLVSIGANEKECMKCKGLIETIQEEIISRKKTYSHYISTPPDYTF